MSASQLLTGLFLLPRLQRLLIPDPGHHLAFPCLTLIPSILTFLTFLPPLVLRWLYSLCPLAPVRPHLSQLRIQLAW